MTIETTINNTPVSIPSGSVDHPKAFLTHSLWVNSYGIPRAETGIRYKTTNGEIERDGFYLVEHGMQDFSTVSAVIIRAIERGWTYSRICKLFWMAEVQHHRNRLEQWAKNHDD